MDTKWAIAVLERWLSLVSEARSVGNYSSQGESIGSGRPQAARLVEFEDQTRRVVQRVLGGSHALLPVVFDEYLLAPGEKAVRLALGRLRTQDETQEHLGTTAPTMAADALHPLIWSAASSLWDSGHFSQAVSRAATFLNADVQDRVGRHDLSDSTLMTEVFSDKPPTIGKSRLRWPGADEDLTVKSMRSGIRMLAPGAFMAIRNPGTHGVEQLSRQDALERLATLSLLARWIDTCETLSA